MHRGSVCGGVMGRKEGRHASTITINLDQAFFLFFFCCTRDFKDSCTSFSEGVCGWCNEKDRTRPTKFRVKKWSILEGKKILSCFVVCVSFSHETAVRPSRSNHPSHTSKANKKNIYIYKNSQLVHSFSSLSIYSCAYVSLFC